MSHLIRVNIVAEGQAEQAFVRELLTEPLSSLGVYPVARCVFTGRKHGQVYRGGMTTYARAKGDIERWLKDDPSGYVTTMFDLYGLPHDFPAPSQATSTHDPYHKARVLEASLAADIQNHHFIPYIQLHEFEGLLFSDVSAIEAVVRTYNPYSRLAELQQIRAQFTTPEEIDDGEQTAPSKRLKSLYPAYEKVLFGSRIAQGIGLDTLRRECPHFNEWLSKLESLAGQGQAR